MHNHLLDPSFMGTRVYYMHAPRYVNTGGLETRLVQARGYTSYTNVNYVAFPMLACLLWYTILLKLILKTQLYIPFS